MDLKNFKNILFLDIETVCCTPTYDQLDERMKPLWDRKAGFINSEISSEELFEEKGAIYAEFGKVITIGGGFFFEDKDNCLSLKIKGLKNNDEKELLIEFKSLLESRFDPRKLTFCAHNGKEFDYPYICRRMLVNGISLPEVLQFSGKKPWEVNHLDTLEMWKFGDKKNYTSLELLAALFNIPGSKNDMDGSMVGKKYYVENNLNDISEYCCKDVAVTAQLFLKMNNCPLIPDENIHIIS